MEQEQQDRPLLTREREVSREAFEVRDLLFFPPKTAAVHEAFSIVVTPDEESLVTRIVMHKSIAARLMLRQISVGEKPRGRGGAGTCEVFLADVPNWTPDNIVITPEMPLVLHVTNVADVNLRILGSVVVFKRGRTI
mgnify:CR=1 FL=1